MDQNDLDNEAVSTRLGAKCWACQSDILEAQKVCLECGSWQNWRRYLNLSTATLGLLVALISVSGTAITAISDRLTQKVAVLHVSGSSQNVRRGEDQYDVTFNLVIRNLGSSVAIVNREIYCISRENLNDYDPEEGGSFAVSFASKDDLFLPENSVRA